MEARVDAPPFDAVFSIAGPFTPVTALQLRVRLAELPPDACVVLDLSRASEVADMALAVLATAIAAPGHPRVVLRGLTHHQERMLRYLGVDVSGVLPGRDDHPGRAG